MPILTEEERLGTLVAGRYRLLSILGRGGTGVVFEASHTWTGRRVAVKLLKPEYARDLGLVRRFLQEARAAAGIEHPNVVSVLDMGNETDGTVYLVLELLEGESLGKRLERGRLDPAEALRVLVPVMDALVVAHDKGIIHRDLKPDNVFLRRDARGRTTPKLLDFGMAKMVDAAWGHATQSGTLVGTPFYMSPEQAEGKPDQGPASDVWSMGVIFHRCLTGELPFHAETPTALLLAIVRGEAPPIGERAPELPEPLARALDRALVADRAGRYADMRAFLDELRAAAERSGVAFPAPPDPEAAEPTEPFDPGPRREEPPARGRRGPWVGLALAAAAIAGVVAFALHRTGESAEAEAPRDPAPVAEVEAAPRLEASADREHADRAPADRAPADRAPADRAPADPEPAAREPADPEPAAREPETAPDAAEGVAIPAARVPAEPARRAEPAADPARRAEPGAGRTQEPRAPGGMRIPGVTREW